MTQTERNQEFDQQPDYEVSEFLIFRNGVLDRKALFQARAARVLRVAGENLSFFGSRVLDSVDEAFVDLSQNGLQTDYYKNPRNWL